MSFITSLRVQHLRTHKLYSLPLSPSVTLITGENGSGKTSLIEAIYIACQGSSFKGSDNEILMHNTSWYRVDLSFNDDSVRTVKFDPQKPNGKKQFTIDHKTHYRLSYVNKYPLVLFEPEDLRLLNGSPTRRRQFIDQFISQLDSNYSITLHRYERALKQRNNLLKQPNFTDDDMFAWNVSLSEYGATIIEKRQKFIESLNERLQEVYRSISHTMDNISIQYSYNYSGSIGQRLLSELYTHSNRDKMLGYTSIGPHRHDVLFELNETPAMAVASRGEIRTIVLALKFLEVSIIESLTNIQPIILLDDVFSELDDSRQKRLIDEFKQYQIVIASVNNFPINGNIVDIIKY
jgi:DNA replication and repair protein RecF